MAATAAKPVTATARRALKERIEKDLSRGERGEESNSWKGSDPNPMKERESSSSQQISGREANKATRVARYQPRLLLQERPA
jgi:hypothetical protein